MTEFSCPGREMPQPTDAPYLGYVACYRAGHECPRSVAIRVVDDGFVEITRRCPCCGDHKGSCGYPIEWEEFW